MLCPNCNRDATVLLIDTWAPLSSPERERRFCYGCLPEARHAYAGCLPPVIKNADISEAEKLAAFRARRFSADRTSTYPVNERVKDLSGL